MEYVREVTLEHAYLEHQRSREIAISNHASRRSKFTSERAHDIRCYPSGLERKIHGKPRKMVIQTLVCKETEASQARPRLGKSHVGSKAVTGRTSAHIHLVVVERKGAPD